SGRGAGVPRLRPGGRGFEWGAGPRPEGGQGGRGRGRAPGGGGFHRNLRRGRHGDPARATPDRGRQLKPLWPAGRVAGYHHVAVPLLLSQGEIPAPAHALGAQIMGTARVVGERDLRHRPAPRTRGGRGPTWTGTASGRAEAQPPPR